MVKAYKRQIYRLIQFLYAFWDPRNYHMKAVSTTIRKLWWLDSRFVEQANGLDCKRVWPLSLTRIIASNLNHIMLK